MYAKAERVFEKLSEDGQFSDPDAKIYFPKKIDPESDLSKQVQMADKKLHRKKTLGGEGVTIKRAALESVPG